MNTASHTRYDVIDGLAVMIVSLLSLLVFMTSARPAPVLGYDCIFHSTRGGMLVDGKIIEPDPVKSPEARISFIVTDPENGVATMRIVPRPAWAIPAKFRREDKVVHFSYEFPGRGAGSVTISRTSTPTRFPAVSTDHGWGDDDLSVAYSIGSCMMAGDG
jgi:hypothetical protein